LAFLILHAALPLLLVNVETILSQSLQLYTAVHGTILVCWYHYWSVTFCDSGLPLLVHLWPTKFWDIETGDWAPSILNLQGFSPLADMLNGFIWHLLWCLVRLDSYNLLHYGSQVSNNLLSAQWVSHYALNLFWCH
jgi:hypothetical protein